MKMVSQSDEKGLNDTLPMEDDELLLNKSFEANDNGGTQLQQTTE